MDAESHGLASQTSVLAFHRPSRRWPFVSSIVVLCLIAAGMGAGFAYSSYSAREWRTSATKSAQDLSAMTKQRDDLKARAGVLQNQLDEATTQLDDVTTEYNAAMDRIRSLSNEKAQVGDDAAFLSGLVAMSQTVTQELDACIDDLQTLETYLVDLASYDSASLMSYAREVYSGCNQARADSDALSRKLAG